jgi:hypothetical protein
MQAPFNYKESLYIPLYIQIPNNGAPKFKQPLKDLKMKVNEIKVI